MRWALRAWNDETLAPDSGFPPLLHTDVEIITCVCLGVLTHEDDLATGAARGPASAGHERGQRPDPCRVQYGGRPGPRGPDLDRAGPARRAAQLGQEDLARDACHGHFLTLASGIAGDEDALPIRSDARVLAVALKAGEAATYRSPAVPSRLSGRVQGAADRQ